MRKEEKGAIIDSLAAQLAEYPHVYITDASGLNAANTTMLRKMCFEKGVKLVVTKNTLLKKALERSGDKYEGLYDSLKLSTAVMFSMEGNVPAKLMKEFQKQSKLERPALKAAYVEESVYVGADMLETLVNIKSKSELLGDIVGLLQSPMKNVVSALQSGGQTIAGVVKTLSEREDK